MQKHKILAFLLALAVSIGLWVYAVTVVNPDDTVYIRDVRVRIIGAGELPSRGLILTGVDNQTVSIEIAGRRSDLKELSSSSVEVTADVRNIYEAGTYELKWSPGYPSTVASGDVNIASASSTRVKVTVSDYKERTDIPVYVDYSGVLPEGYTYNRDDTELTPESVTVSGPAEEVDRIAAAFVTVNMEGAKASINEEMNYRLVDQDGEELELSEYVTIADPTVRISVPVYYSKQIKLEVNLIPGGGVTADDVELTISPKAIWVKGAESALKDLDVLFIEDINLAEITQSQSLEVELDLPAGVTNLAEETAATITISFKDYIQTKTFTIRCSDFIRENDIEDLEFAQQSISITLRGPKTAIDAIRAEDIKVIAEMANSYDENGKRVPLRIELPKNTTAGVIDAPANILVTDTAEEQ